jgi:hypothetical protein
MDGGTIPATPLEVPNNQILQFISLKVMKDQMDSQKELVSVLMAQSLQFTGAYTRNGSPAPGIPGGNIDITI